MSLSCGRIGLLVSNIVLMVIAVTCIAGGVVLVIGEKAYGSELDWLDDILQSAATASGVTNLDSSDLDLTFMTRPLGITLIVVGFVIVIITILGIIAAAGTFYKFVIFYLVVLLCIYFAQIVVVICAYIDRDPFDNTVKDMLKDSLEDYTGIEGEDKTTLGWNAFMAYKKCCGVDDYNDFSVSSNWPGTLVMTLFETPAVCCITHANPPTCAEVANYQTQTYYNRGCYEHMWDHVTSYTGLIIFAVFFIFLLEFLCAFFAVWIFCERKSEGLDKIGIDYDDHYYSRR